MEPDAYLEMASSEESHWWFRGRRAISSHVIGALGLPSEAKILEIGAGTGGNLKMLAEFGNVQAGELDDFARAHATQKTNVPIVRAELPGDLPFAPDYFRSGVPVRCTGTRRGGRSVTYRNSETDEAPWSSPPYRTGASVDVELTRRPASSLATILPTQVGERRACRRLSNPHADVFQFPATSCGDRRPHNRPGYPARHFYGVICPGALAE